MTPVGPTRRDYDYAPHEGCNSDSDGARWATIWLEGRELTGVRAAVLDSFALSKIDNGWRHDVVRVAVACCSRLGHARWRWLARTRASAQRENAMRGGHTAGKLEARLDTKTHAVRYEGADSAD